MVLRNREIGICISALELALTVEKLYEKDEWAGTSRVNEKIIDLKNILERLNELEPESNM